MTYAYEDPVALAKSAQMLRAARLRRLRRLAVEQAAAGHGTESTAVDSTASSGGGRGAVA